MHEGGGEHVVDAEIIGTQGDTLYAAMVDLGVVEGLMTSEVGFRQLRENLVEHLSL